MHVIKVAQLSPRSMHFVFELAEVYVSYSGEILELVQGTKCTNLTWSIASRQHACHPQSNVIQESELHFERNL